MDVVDHYNHGDGIRGPWLDEDMQPLALSESEIDDVVAFLATLTSAQYQELGAKELARARVVEPWVAWAEGAVALENRAPIFIVLWLLAAYFIASRPVS